MSVRIKKILEQIDSGKRENLYDIKITLKEFLSKDVDGVTFLEKVLKKGIHVGSLNLKKLNNSIEAAFILHKNGRDNDLLYSLEFDEDSLFLIYEGKRLIDLLLGANALNVETLKKVKNHVEIVDLVSHNVYYLMNLNPEIINKLITKDKNGNYLIEKYINSKFIDILINQINNLNVLQELAKKYNNHGILKDVNAKVLMEKITPNKTLLEDLLSKNIIPNIFDYLPKNIKFINFLRKLNLYNYLKKAKEEVFLIKVKGRKTLLEDVIEHGVEPSITSIFDKETIKLLNKLNRLDLINDIDENFLLSSVYDVLGKGSKNKLFIEYLLEKKPKSLLKTHILSNCTIINLFYEYGYYEFLSKRVAVDKLFAKVKGGLLIKKLLEKNLNLKLNISISSGDINFLLDNKLDDGSTYFDFILQNIKDKKIKYNLNSLMMSLSKIQDIVAMYFAIANQDMVEYVDRLEEKDLLKEYNDKTLLEHLLEKNSELAINKLLSEKVKSKLKISTIIKSYGLKCENVDVPLKNKNYAKEYILEKDNTFGIGPLKQEGELLINKLKDLFDNDGVSDKSLVNSLITGYRQSLFENYGDFINELKVLIQLKENNMEKLAYIKIDDNAYYNPQLGRVFSGENIVDTILHETGHLLHSYLMNMIVPNEFLDSVKKLRTNPELLKKVEMYASKYAEIKERVYALAEKKYDEFCKNYYDSNKIKEIDGFIEKTLNEKKKEFKLLNISDEKLEIILNNSFTRGEYIKHQKKVFIEEYVNAIFSYEFSSFRSIGDILDAIYEGELHSGKLKNEKGELINKTAGHGIAYYYGYNDSFAEILANFASIVKSQNSNETLKFLKSLIGEELYNIISDFYYKNIVFATLEEREENKNIN